MNRPRRIPRPVGRTAACALLIATGLAAAGTARAQDRGWVGVLVGKPDYRLTCGVIAGGCDDPSVRAHLRVGAGIGPAFGAQFGAELGWVDEGRLARAGGDTRADGLVLAGVARVPLGRFSAHARLGAVYDRTRVSALPLSGVAEGRERGWGPSVALGGGFDLTQSGTLQLEWSRNVFRFPGAGREPVDALSIGWEQRF